ncbi:hypothetical protein [Anaeromyxobacter oryzae]|uniref:Cell division protein FtsL n=1 Tax=Anaeromyxobacter oryzae TaxID=2918170 RepID=A0ABM7WT65_9BACT|nr:hypothetical protein [Anaeromyxobacter oryzae]BDG02681.1 hypothetical protein AMOR_16770 [Anaeromyxobacter oryzae]
MSARALPRRAPRAGAEIVAVALALVAVGVFHVWSRTRVLAAGYELGELQKQHAELVAAHDALRIELEMVRSPAKLEEAVRTRLARLGMAPPDRGAVLAAGPGRPLDGTGRAGVDGVGDRSRPAGPALHTAPATAPGRAAAGPAAAPGDRVALRGPLRAGRARPRDP